MAGNFSDPAAVVADYLTNSTYGAGVDQRNLIRNRFPSFDVHCFAMEAQADALMPDGTLMPIVGYMLEEGFGVAAQLHREAGRLGGVKAVIYLTTI